MRPRGRVGETGVGIEKVSTSFPIDKYAADRKKWMRMVGLEEYDVSASIEFGSGPIQSVLYPTVWA